MTTAAAYDPASHTLTLDKTLTELDDRDCRLRVTFWGEGHHNPQFSEGLAPHCTVAGPDFITEQRTGRCREITVVVPVAWAVTSIQVQEALPEYGDPRVYRDLLHWSGPYRPIEGKRISLLWRELTECG